jgi:hypothetical protein
MDGRNKYQSRENRIKLREAPMREWDPIGVCGVPEAQDEYDAYVGKVYVMLMDERASVEMIAACLFDVATEHMGSSGRQVNESSRRTAEILVSLRPTFETH